MKRGKYERAVPAAPKRRRRVSGAKLGILILALTMLIGSTLGGTLAYLTDTAGAVKNTFTVGNVGKLTLTETTGDTYVVIPGVDIKKDPTLTYTGNNIAAYIFVQVASDEWTYSDGVYSVGEDAQMQWTVADGWTHLDGGVFYRTVGANTATRPMKIIKNDEITVSHTITAAEIAGYASTLTFSAYAIQYEGFDSPAEAWAAVNAK